MRKCLTPRTLAGRLSGLLHSHANDPHRLGQGGALEGAEDPRQSNEAEDDEGAALGLGDARREAGEDRRGVHEVARGGDEGEHPH